MSQTKNLSDLSNIFLEIDGAICKTLYQRSLSTTGLKFETVKAGKVLH
jgi:hypothetical protein